MKLNKYIWNEQFPANSDFRRIPISGEFRFPVTRSNPSDEIHEESSSGILRRRRRRRRRRRSRHRIGSRVFDVGPCKLHGVMTMERRRLFFFLFFFVIETRKRFVSC